MVTEVAGRGKENFVGSERIGRMRGWATICVTFEFKKMPDILSMWGCGSGSGTNGNASTCPRWSSSSPSDLLSGGFFLDFAQSVLIRVWLGVVSDTNSLWSVNTCLLNQAMMLAKNGGVTQWIGAF
jgi:hypothetical protein